MKEKNSLMRLFRLMNFSYKKKLPLFPNLIMKIIRVIYSCDLPYSCHLGKGVVFKHNGLGVVVHPKAIIGDNTQIYQNVSIAGRNNRGTPIIGKNVFIGAGACILGGIRIGDNAMIGANAVVVGIPGEIVKINSQEK